MEEKLTALDPLPIRVPERFFKGLLIGYGYRPARSGWGLGVISGLGALLYWREYRMGKITPTDKEAAGAFKPGGPLPDHYPGFQPAIFSLENTFPLVKLGPS